MVTEFLRWVVIIVPIYLSVWRYATLRGYTVFIPGEEDLHTQFWGVVTALVLGGTLVLYVPIKVFAVVYRLKNGLMKGMAW